MAGKGTPDSGATFTIEKCRSRSVTRFGMAYNPPSAEPTDEIPELTTQEPTPGTMPGQPDTSARSSHLLPGDLVTDSNEDGDVIAEELLERETRRLEERAKARGAAQQTSETEC